MLTLYLIPTIAVILIVGFIVVSMRGRLARVAERVDPETGFAIPNSGVPHCDFTRTADGFIVKFNKASVGFHQSIHKLSGTTGAAGGAASLLAMGAVAATRLAQGDTIIEVTREAVIVDGKKMRRHHFSGFNVSTTFQGRHLDKTVAVLGYRFGTESFEFGGTFPVDQAQEVASALNNELREAPTEQVRASSKKLLEERSPKF